MNREVHVRFCEEQGVKPPCLLDYRQGFSRKSSRVLAELLFIHPFREGNGRTARILANLMARKNGYGSLLFDKVGEQEFEIYVSAVQMAAKKEYKKMEKFITSIFPG